MIFKHEETKKSDYLRQYAIGKLQALTRRYPFAIKAAVTLKKVPKDYDKGNICGIKLSLPGPEIYASSNENNFIRAINNTVKNLGVLLEKRKLILVHK